LVIHASDDLFDNGIGTPRQRNGDHGKEKARERSAHKES
jgi:hypothetical protein